MNVHDTEAPKVTDDMLEMIFARQNELMEKYIEIENKSGIGKGILAGETFDIDRPRSQAVCKDFAWRITEELSESMEAFYSGKDDEYLTHAKEECIDALHFLVELYLIVGITPQTLVDTDEGDKLKARFSFKVAGEIDPYNVIHSIGLAMNCLKQKPWKQTHMKTDVERFRKYLIETFFHWTVFAKKLGLDADGVFDLYFRKSEVNKFRQRSNY